MDLKVYADGVEQSFDDAQQVSGDLSHDHVDNDGHDRGNLAAATEAATLKDPVCGRSESTRLNSSHRH